MARMQTAWGLDVGTTSLKAIKLQRQGDAVTLLAFDIVEHDKFLTAPDVDRDEIIRHTLAKFLERHPIKGEPIFIGVPGSSTFARFVKLPPVEPKKVPEIVRFEAIQQIPFPLEQVNWDYQTFSNPDSPEVEVGIFAMKKELVAQIMSNFQTNKMVIQGVQMSPLAVFNAVQYDELTEGKGTVVLDIGAEHTDLIFIDQGRLWLRTINIGGNAFTDALSKSFKVPFAKAEQLKRTAATNKYAKQIFQAMRPVFADLVAEIQRSIGFYNSGHRDAKLDRVIGMGNPFKLPNLQKYLQQNLQMEVIRLENFKKVTIDSKLAPGLNEHILGLPSAYGLALQGLDLAAIDTNLLPMEIARQMLWQQKRSWFVAAAVAIVAGAAVAGFQVMSDYSAFGEPDRENDNVLAKAINIKSEFDRIPEKYETNKKEVESFLNLTSERKIWPTIVNDFVSSLPQSISPDKANAPERTQQQMIVLKRVLSDYQINLQKATASSTPTESQSSSSGSFDDANNNPSPSGPPAGFNQPPVQPTGGGSATPGTSIEKNPNNDISANRGFIVTLIGYTPYAKGDDLVLDYIRQIAQKAPAPVEDPSGSKDPKAPKKWIDPRPDLPYYFEIATEGSYEGRKIKIDYPRLGTSGAPTFKLEFIKPWGVDKGPFLELFGADLVGLKPLPEVAPAPGGALAPMPVMGDAATNTVSGLLNKPMDPDAPGRDMNGYFEFKTVIRVHMKNPPTPAS